MSQQYDILKRSIERGARTDLSAGWKRMNSDVWEEDRGVKELLPLVAIVALWVLLQTWILPRFGVST